MTVSKRSRIILLALAMAGLLVVGCLTIGPAHLAVVIFFVAAVPALGFPILYHFGSPWRTTIVGKMMMTKSSAIAVVFLLSMVRFFAPGAPGLVWLAVLAYTYLAIALYFQTGVLLREQRHQQGREYEGADVGKRPGVTSDR